MPEQPEKPRLRHWLFLLLVVICTIVVDQITKAYVAAHLDPYESWMPLSFIEPVFRLTHIHNTGAAFGLFPDGGMVFIVIAVVVSAVIMYYHRELPANAWLVRLALGLQLGGALGNVVDRLRQGYVVDFFNVELWPVFNVADSCIVLGVALLAFEMLREEWRANRQKQSEDNGEAPPDASEEVYS
ncbi:MAG: signal peptidase II [Anaerolineae bacterium]|nr:signal peptidase II [Anaerolineae bacterium]